MSAIARYFHTLGIKVSGYDKTETTLTRQLVAEGISIHYDDTISQIPEAVQNGTAEDTPSDFYSRCSQRSPGTELVFA